MPDVSTPQRKRRMLKVALQLVLVVIFVLMIVYFLNRYSADISSLRLLTVLDILLISIWSFVSFSAYAYAVYAMLVDAGLKNLRPFAWLRIYFASRLVNLFVIQGGNLFRLFVLKKKYDFSYANSIGVTALLIWLNALIALLASCIFLLSISPPGVAGGNRLLALSIMAFAGILLMPWLLSWVVKTFKQSAILPTKVLEPIAKIANYFPATLANRQLMMWVTGLSVVHFMFFVGVNYFSFSALGQEIDIFGACIFTTAFVFTRYINIVPGNLGLSELIGGLVAEQLGIGFGGGLLVAGIVRMVEVITIVIIGLFYGKFLVLDYFRNRQDVA